MGRFAGPSSMSTAPLERSCARHLWSELSYAIGMRGLPPQVARFHWRARRLAWRDQDAFSLISATRPRDLGVLLKLARGRSNVVELGTATGWTAIALALADPTRNVLTYDVVARPERERYLGLVPGTVRERISFVKAAGSAGPPEGLATSIDLLYIDSSHDREATIAELGAWQDSLSPAAVVVLDDYNHPSYPGVREAVQELGLRGMQCGTMYVHGLGPT